MTWQSNWIGGCIKVVITSVSRLSLKGRVWIFSLLQFNKNNRVSFCRGKRANFHAPYPQWHVGRGGCSAGHQEAGGTHRPAHGRDHGDDAQVRYRHQVSSLWSFGECRHAVRFARMQCPLGIALILYVYSYISSVFTVVGVNVTEYTVNFMDKRYLWLLS